MKKLALVALLFPMVMVHAINQDPQSVLQWVQQTTQNSEIVSTLNFYFHDIVSGSNPTAIPVAQPNIGTFGSSQSTNSFGSVYIVDDMLTDRPEAGSNVVGRAQGIYGSASMGEMGLLMTMNFVFTSGDYNGSTLSVLGRNPILENYREMAVVGGSGYFRLARGIATAKTHSMNPNGDAIVEYNVVVQHY